MRLISLDINFERSAYCKKPLIELKSHLQYEVMPLRSVGKNMNPDLYPTSSQ